MSALAWMTWVAPVERVAQSGWAVEVDDATFCGLGDVIDAGREERHRLHILAQQLGQDLAAGRVLGAGQRDSHGLIVSRRMAPTLRPLLA